MLKGPIVIVVSVWNAVYEPKLSLDDKHVATPISLDINTQRQL